MPIWNGCFQNLEPDIELRPWTEITIFVNWTNLKCKLSGHYKKPGKHEYLILFVCFLHSIGTSYENNYSIRSKKLKHKSDETKVWNYSSSVKRNTSHHWIKFLLWNLRHQRWNVKFFQLFSKYFQNNYIENQLLLAAPQNICNSAI